MQYGYFDGVGFNVHVPPYIVLRSSSSHPTAFASPVRTGVLLIIVERFFDGIWLAVCIGVTAMFVNLPRDLIDSAEILGVIILVATIFFIIMLVLKKKPHERQKLKTASGWKPVRWGASFFAHLITVIQEIGTSKNFYLSLMISSLILVTQIVSFWLVMSAYGLKLSLWVGAAVLLILHLGTLIPNAPSNVGLFQFFCVVGLSIFGIDKTTAAGFLMSVFTRNNRRPQAALFFPLH